MVRSLVKESQPFLFEVDMLQNVLTEWEFNFDIFSTFEGNHIAYGTNPDGSDWVSEIWIADGKFYIAAEDVLNEDLAVENPRESIKAVAISLRSDVRDALKSVRNSYSWR